MEHRYTHIKSNLHFLPVNESSYFSIFVMQIITKNCLGTVFLHEMAHAWFDRFPLLQPKSYIPEIEEPIVECLSLNILFAFVEMSRFFYPHGELLDMFDTAYSMVYAKRRLKKLCYYSLGIEIFHSDWGICNLYSCFCYYLDEQSQDVKNYVAQFANGFPQQPYTCLPMLTDLLNYMQ